MHVNLPRLKPHITTDRLHLLDNIPGRLPYPTHRGGSWIHQVKRGGQRLYRFYRSMGMPERALEERQHALSLYYHYQHIARECLTRRL